MNIDLVYVPLEAQTRRVSISGIYFMRSFYHRRQSRWFSSYNLALERFNVISRVTIADRRTRDT